jgi:hypothetical protein
MAKRANPEDFIQHHENDASKEEPSKQIVYRFVPQQQFSPAQFSTFQLDPTTTTIGFIVIGIVAIAGIVAIYALSRR